MSTHIKLKAAGELQPSGKREVFFEANGWGPAPRGWKEGLWAGRRGAGVHIRRRAPDARNDLWHPPKTSQNLTKLPETSPPRSVPRVVELADTRSAEGLAKKAVREKVGGFDRGLTGV